MHNVVSRAGYYHLLPAWHTKQKHPILNMSLPPCHEDTELRIKISRTSSVYMVCIFYLHLFCLPDLPTETTYSTEDNGKINIHVSVTINASTLAELKKQRAQHRNSSPDISLYPSYHPQIVPSSDNADPEVSTVKRFAGNTGDHLVGDPRTTRCCVLL